jgi:hypothetical protein
MHMHAPHTAQHTARTTHHNTSQKTQQYAYYFFTRSFCIIQDGVSAAAVFVEMAEQLKRQGKVTN